MSAQQDSADPEIVGTSNTEPGTIECIDETLTPLQYHYLSLLQRLVAVKNSYQTDPDFENWIMDAIKKSIYSTLRDCIEATVGDSGKELLKQEQLELHLKLVQ